MKFILSSTSSAFCLAEIGFTKLDVSRRDSFRVGIPSLYRVFHVEVNLDKNNQRRQCCLSHRNFSSESRVKFQRITSNLILDETLYALEEFQWFAVTECLDLINMKFYAILKLRQINFFGRVFHVYFVSLKIWGIKLIVGLNTCYRQILSEYISNFF